MKPRILFILQLPPPYHGASIANELIIKSDIINNNFEAAIIDIKTARSITNLGKFSFSKVSLSVKLFFRIFSRLVAFKPHLVYFTLAPAGFAFYRDALYIFLIKLLRYKLIIHFHGKGIKAGTEGSFLFRFLTRKILSGSYTIHLSPILANDVPDNNIRKRYFVPYGVPVIIGNQLPIKKEGEKVNLLFLSNYVISKGILDLIDAIEIVVSKNTNLHLRLVGSPADISIEALNTYIDNKRLQAFISVCGPRYNNEKHEELQKADIFILPTYYSNEAFPVSLLEAMQYGLAIISCREGGIPDMIRENSTGLLVDQRDVKDLADKIIFLINNTTERKKLGTNARKTFMEQYTLAVFENNMLRAFTDALAGK